jgi:putative tryptophan/tyrosine transport system substrate-binding protein
MRRREFIAGLAGAAPWPVAAYAQQRSALPVIGILRNSTLATIPSPFRKGLSDMGYEEGRNVIIEYRVTDQVDRLPALAAELVERRVTVIYAQVLTAAAAAKAATATIPIVFTGGGDPVRSGLVASLNRPGGNLTGMTGLSIELGPKRLELLREVVPQAALIGILSNPRVFSNAGSMSDLQAAARSVGQEIVILNIRTGEEIDAAFATAAARRVGGLLVDTSVSQQFGNRRDQIVALAERYAIPAIYPTRGSVSAGGLMSYDARESDQIYLFYQAGIYVGRILKGEKPADLPVLQPTKFEFVINLKTAKALGLTVPQSILLRADEVIE